jgi:hypothetical protein
MLIWPDIKAGELYNQIFQLAGHPSIFRIHHPAGHPASQIRYHAEYRI